jgi:predicted deacylase
MTDSRPWEKLGPGGDWSGWWEAPGEAGIRLPLLMVRGRAPGPLLLAVAGVHGDEYEGPAAVQDFHARLSRKGLVRGTFVGLPHANPPAWGARSRVSPSDGVDLNRVFPGEPDAGPTPGLARAIFDTFVRPADALIDLHSGGLRMEHLPMVGWYRGATRSTESAARTFNPRLHPWWIPDTPGVLSREAHRLGKSALGLEWGGGGRLDPEGVSALSEGLKRWLTAFGLIRPERVPPTPDTRRPLAGNYQMVERAGVFTAEVRLGDRVRKGQRLGRVRDAFGEVVASPRSFRAGRIAALPVPAYLHPGDPLTYIG